MGSPELGLIKPDPADEMNGSPPHHHPPKFTAGLQRSRPANLCWNSGRNTDTFAISTHTPLPFFSALHLLLLLIPHRRRRDHSLSQPSFLTGWTVCVVFVRPCQLPGPTSRAGHENLFPPSFCVPILRVHLHYHSSTHSNCTLESASNSCPPRPSYSVLLFFRCLNKASEE